MVDDLKKKKLDSKRISLKQRHEVDYLKKIAKQQKKQLELMAANKTATKLSFKKCIRICKALLKCLK